MLFESEDGPPIEDPTADDIDKSLRLLDGENNGFAFLISNQGSYIQVAGGPERFAVEVRICKPDHSFRHWRIRPPGSVPGHASESADPFVASLPQVQELFRSFHDGEPFDPASEWEDITGWF